MNGDDPAARHFIRRCMVARIATLSHNGRPSVTSLYFVLVQGRIWLGTSDWTLAAREVKSNPRVSLLFQVERDPQDRRILRLNGSAKVRTDPQTLRRRDVLMALKYILTPGGLRNQLANLHLREATRRYRAQGSLKGQPCVIDVTPEQAEFLEDSWSAQS
jgi:uncharacterized pyridoxamine 5'-phosphate oxidase family protein